MTSYLGYLQFILLPLLYGLRLVRQTLLFIIYLKSWTSRQLCKCIHVPKQGLSLSLKKGFVSRINRRIYSFVSFLCPRCWEPCSIPLYLLQSIETS